MTPSKVESLKSPLQIFKTMKNTPSVKSSSASTKSKARTVSQTSRECLSPLTNLNPSFANGKLSSKPTQTWKPQMVTCYVFSSLHSPSVDQIKSRRRHMLSLRKSGRLGNGWWISCPRRLPVGRWRTLCKSWFLKSLGERLRSLVILSTLSKMYYPNFFGLWYLMSRCTSARWRFSSRLNSIFKSCWNCMEKMQRRLVLLFPEATLRNQRFRKASRISSIE